MGDGFTRAAPGKSRLIALLPLLLACTTTPDRPTAQAELILEEGWSAAPWQQDHSGPEIRISGTFDLGEAPGGGSVLVVEGGWWHLTATVNETLLPTVTGGLTEAHIPIGEHLRRGKNTLALHIAPPAGIDPILTGGSLSSIGRAQGTALLQAPPRLLLRPDAHIEDAWLEVRDGQLHPHATAAGAPDGSTVRFFASLDGRETAALGTAPLRDGRADAPPGTNILSVWQPGIASLFHLHAELLDASGTRLDAAVVRTGIRELDAAPLSINGSPLRLMGTRVVNRGSQTNLADTFAGFAPAGINAVEIHGETFRRDWLEAADELGLPVVVVPRCIGRSSRHTGERAAMLATMTQQDVQTARLLRRHPAVVLLASEGPAAQKMPLWTDALLGSGIPLAIHDLPIRILSLKAGDTLETTTLRCQPKDCRGAWLVELTPWWRTVQEGEKPDSRTRWRLLSEALVKFMTTEGSIGAIVPSPNPREVIGWESAWQKAATALSIVPVEGSGRGRSEVVVTGAVPGQTVWLSAPLAPTVATIADATGTARLTLWHDGLATVRAGGVEQRITLTPGRWDRYTWQSAVVEVTLQQ